MTIHKKVAISQSNYIPWKGYFDMIAAVDEFIIYDEMQYTRRDWRNRNLIKTPTGLNWLTVPVKVKGKYDQRICDTEIDGTAWSTKHWKTLISNYRKSSYFDEVSKVLKPIYFDNNHVMLSDLNRTLIFEVCRYLNITTKISSASEYRLWGTRSERLLNLCMQVGATEYISGPAAQEYLDENIFRSNNIGVYWFNYDNYREYPQLWGGFNHKVSVIDLLFNCGRDATKFLRYKSQAEMYRSVTSPLPTVSITM
jgi:hypothetical protein